MITRPINQSEPKLPTLKQWLKATELLDESIWTVEKVLWNDQFRSITFFTGEFRYSIKSKDKEEHIALVGWVLDHLYFQDGNLIGDMFLAINPSEGSVQIDFRPLVESETYCTWKQWDWGLTCDLLSAVEHKPKKPKQNKRTTPAKPKPIS